MKSNQSHPKQGARGVNKVPALLRISPWGGNAGFTLTPTEEMKEMFKIKFRNQVKEMIRAIGGTPNHQSMARLVKDYESPLALLVQSCPVPPRFKLPALETFDGSNDPIDHWHSVKT